VLARDSPISHRHTYYSLQVHVSDATFQRCRNGFKWEKAQMTHISGEDGLQRTHIMIRAKTKKELDNANMRYSLSSRRRRGTS
jgi:hypothetical protein